MSACLPGIAYMQWLVYRCRGLRLRGLRCQAGAQLLVVCDRTRRQVLAALPYNSLSLCDVTYTSQACLHVWAWHAAQGLRGNIQ